MGTIPLRTHGENECAIFMITTTGPCISAEHPPNIFDRFYCTDDSRSRHTGGAGLGFAICEAIAVAHDGTLEGASIVGRGSTFTLRLSLGRSAEAQIGERLQKFYEGLLMFGTEVEVTFGMLPQ